MERWFLLAGVYSWLGFTMGYFFRKWLERTLEPAWRTFQGLQEERPPQMKRPSPTQAERGRE
ncbi:MAG: hypothetical protein OEW39_01820 [Deltaproteobacteria bacterium]|nr:hypothetical protein [Deltaproteobacteria bacterium]